MAKVRTLFRQEVEALLPELHETYRLIGRFQEDRAARHEAPLRAQLERVGERLQFFKPYLQVRKQVYFDALMRTDLSLSDRIVALDTAVGMMHIEFAVERAYAHRESLALRRVLEESRVSADDGAPAGPDGGDDCLLLASFPVAPAQNRPAGSWAAQVLPRLEAEAGDLSPTIQSLASAVKAELEPSPIPWGLTHGDVRGPNVLYTGQTVGFTDFNPKVLPLLRDVVMIRNKWLMNGDVAHERPLTMQEIAGFIRGYAGARPLTEAECHQFPVVWAVYQADRVLRDRRIMAQSDPARAARWPIAEQARALPGELERARALLHLALSSD